MLVNIGNQVHAVELFCEDRVRFLCDNVQASLGEAQVPLCIYTALLSRCIFIHNAVMEHYIMLPYLSLTLPVYYGIKTFWVFGSKCTHIWFQ